MSPLARREQVTGIVLAGGRSRRFGADKLAATIDGDTVLELALRAVDQVAGAILVAGPMQPTVHGGTGPPARFIDDVEPFAGPLAALGGTLRQVATEFAIVIGGDMPRLVPAVLHSMLEHLAADAAIDAVVLETASRDMPPHLQVLPVALRVAPSVAAANDALGAGDRSLVQFLGRIRLSEIPAESWLAFDPKGESTADIDIPDDLEQFRSHKCR